MKTALDIKREMVRKLENTGKYRVYFGDGNDYITLIVSRQYKTIKEIVDSDIYKEYKFFIKKYFFNNVYTSLRIDFLTDNELKDKIRKEKLKSIL